MVNVHLSCALGKCVSVCLTVYALAFLTFSPKLLDLSSHLGAHHQLGKTCKTLHLQVVTLHTQVTEVTKVTKVKKPLVGFHTVSKTIRPINFILILVSHGTRLIFRWSYWISRSLHEVTRLLDYFQTFSRKLLRQAYQITLGTHDVLGKTELYQFSDGHREF